MPYNFFTLMRDPPACEDCGPLPTNHVLKYLSSLFGYLLPQTKFPFADKAGYLIDKFFIAAKLLERKEIFPRNVIALRTLVFIDEAPKWGIDVWALKGPLGFINQFHMELGGERHSFEGLPQAGFAGSRPSEFIDDKAKIKTILSKAGFPIAEGRHFWFFQTSQARRYADVLGFPLVVKPRTGSMSQHVTINIRTKEELERAMARALRYDPCFIVERCLEDAHIFRATVVDGFRVACVERVPAHVVGDGTHTIGELAAIKNQDPRRGYPKQKDTTLYRLVIDETIQDLLREQGLNLDSVPEAGQNVFLQRKVILDLGGDLFEVTAKLHPDNAVLFKSVAKIFGLSIIGIDFLAEDIGKPWHKQKCAILELNSLPYIDMHHFPTEGEPINVASWVCEMAAKYYL